MNSENIYSALYDLLKTLPGFTTVSRKLILVEDCDPTIMPALYIKQQNRKVRDRVNDGIATWLLGVDLFIYVAMGDETTPASPVFNPLVDSIANALPPIAVLPQTSAGVEFNAFISGEITFFEGWLGTKSVIHVPIGIIAPDNA